MCVCVCVCVCMYFIYVTASKWIVKWEHFEWFSYLSLYFFLFLHFKLNEKLNNIRLGITFYSI